MAVADVEEGTSTVFGALTRLPPPGRGHHRLGKVFVTGGSLAAAPFLIQSDGAFVLPNLPLGSYSVTVEFDDIVWPQVRLDVSGGRVRAQTNDVVGNTLSLPGGDDLSAPFELVPVGKHGFYIPREEFSLMGLLKSPMVLMLGLPMAMMAIMKLMPQDELRQQMKQMGKDMQTLTGGDTAGASGQAAINAKKKE